MQNGKSYIRDSGYFLEKIKNIRTFSENAILVTRWFVPKYFHQAGLSALKEAFENMSVKKNTIRNPN